MVDFPSPPDQTQQLLLQQGHVEQAHPPSVERGLQRLVQLRLALRRDQVLNLLPLEITTEGLARVRVPRDRPDVEASQGPGEPRDGGRSEEHTSELQSR